MLTAATILAETNGFELFKNYKQLVSYALMLLNESLAPVQGKQNIKGNSHRRALFMPAFVAVKHNENQQWIYTIEPLKTWH
jgi:hypothetical protein